MRPSRFVASLAVATGFGFVVGRCTVPPAASVRVQEAAPTLTAEARREATVIRTVDGDTLVLSLPNAPGGEERVRLLAIDTPERGQQWYAESRAALAELVREKPVRLEFESADKPKRDKYGRLLVYLIVDGQNANVEMIRRGWSAYVSKYGGERYHTELAAAEEEARAAHRGIWSSRP